MPDDRIGRSGDGDDAVTAVERVRQELNRTKHTKSAIFGILFLLAVASSLWVSEVSVGKFVDGWPGLVGDIQGTLPVIRAGHIAADVAEWYWGIGRWVSLLLDTLLIAFMGTLLGTASALVLWLPSRA